MASESVESYELYADCLLVEKLKEPELKVGSIYLAPVSSHSSFKADRPHFVRILALGKGFYNEETNEDVPLNVQAGDIVLVGPISVKYFSTFGDLEAYEPDTIGITREAEILWRFKGEEGWKQVFTTLNKHTKKALDPT